MSDQNITYFNPLLSAEIMLKPGAVHLQPPQLTAKQF